MGTKDFWMENLSHIFQQVSGQQVDVVFSVYSVLALLLPL